MIKLFRKSIILNKKNIFLGILISTIISLVRYEPSEKAFIFATILSPLSLFYDFVGKLMYSEGIKPSEKFLLTLPTSKKDLILEKNYLAYISIVGGIFISLISGFLFSTILNIHNYFNIGIVMTVFSANLLYCTTYIYLNYVYNYHTAQKSSFIIIIFLFIIVRLFKNITFMNNFSICLITFFAISFNIFVIYILIKLKEFNY